jgi:hypothetical protein
MRESPAQGHDATSALRRHRVGRQRNGKGLVLERDPARHPVLDLHTDAGEPKIVPEPAGTRGHDDHRRSRRLQVGRACRQREVVGRIHVKRAAGRSFRRIAAELDAEGVRTAHGGAKWWPSTVRTVMSRTP